ncbi:hypothetical protein M8494_22795 [Serratia ureilytica]
MQDALAECDIDWCEQTKTGGAASAHACANRLEEKAKVQRYLLYRGFFRKKFSQFTVIFAQ